MARLPNQQMTPGAPDKPKNLSERAAAEWDRIMGELHESNIQVAKAHRGLVANAATISADIADAWETVQTEGAYFENAKTGSMQMHPAARRLDNLRRDYIKVMSLLGLRAATSGSGGPAERSLEDAIG
jgi:P27 family predicted phage terminase small subunit